MVTVTPATGAPALSAMAPESVAVIGALPPVTPPLVPLVPGAEPPPLPPPPQEASTQSPATRVTHLRYRIALFRSGSGDEPRKRGSRTYSGQAGPDPS